MMQQKGTTSICLKSRGVMGEHSRNIALERETEIGQVTLSDIRKLLIPRILITV